VQQINEDDTADLYANSSPRRRRFIWVKKQEMMILYFIIVMNA